MTNKLPVIAAAASVAVQVCPAETINNISELIVDRRQQNHAGMGRRAARQDRRSRRSSTEQAVPLRHGQQSLRLNASFIAQILGQAMDDAGEVSSGAFAAYDRPPSAARFCDRYL